MPTHDGLDRRSFLKTAGGALAIGLAPTADTPVAAQALTEKNRLERIATNSYALRQLFKTRSRPGGGRGASGSGRGTAEGGRVARVNPG